MTKWIVVAFGAVWLRDLSWWCHQMEPFSALWALCAGNSPVTGDFPAKGQWRGALIFSMVCAWINGWVNNREAGDLRCHWDAHYDVTVMIPMRNDEFFGAVFYVIDICFMVVYVLMYFYCICWVFNVLFILPVHCQKWRQYKDDQSIDEHARVPWIHFLCLMMSLCELCSVPILTYWCNAIKTYLVKRFRATNNFLLFRRIFDLSNQQPLTTRECFFYHSACKDAQPNSSQRAHDAIITSLWRQNDVATLFWRHNDVIFASCARWDCGLVTPNGDIELRQHCFR